MSDRSLQGLIDGIRTRLHEELDVQLRAMTDSHGRDVEHAREAAREEADQRWAGQLEAARLEWNTRLQAEVASVRSESERALIAETMRARVQAEQAAAESTSIARRELEQSFATERRRLEEQLDAERTRAVDVNAERDRLAADLDAGRRTMATFDAERQRLAAAIEAEQQKGRADLEAERERQRQDRDAEAQRRAADTDEQRRRIAELEQTAGQQAADLEAERTLRASHVEEERARGTVLQAEVDRLARELEALVARHAERPVSDPAPETAITPEAERAAAVPPPLAVLPSPETEPAPPPVDLSTLSAALRTIETASSLGDLLGAAVRAAASAAPRAALFVIHGTELREWPVDGVSSVDSGPLRVDGREAGVIADALRRHEPVATNGDGGATPPYFATLPRDGVAVAVPLLLAGTPVAVLYADQGAGPSAPADWKESVQILGRHAAVCAASLTAVRTAQALRFISASALPAAAGKDDKDDVQAARRYARLLVSEIKLYNESAVRLGRERRDLLLRLEPEIDRARRLYDERVPASVSDRHAVFHQELAQTLADGNHALLGSTGGRPPA